MSRVYTINSEVEIQKETDRYFRLNRAIEQKSLYLEDGSDMYYSFGVEKKPHVKGSFNWEKNYELISNELKKTNKKIAFISLGCGDANREKKMLDKIESDGIEIHYFGIDSSTAMIDLANKNLEKCKFKKKFICADFSSDNFAIELDKILSKFPKKIFAFLGNTLGNVPQGYIADTLSDILKKKDLLWLDVSIRENISESSAGEIFERYLKYISNPKWEKFVTSTLIGLGFKREDGELFIAMVKEKSLNALKVNFNISIKNQVDINLENHKVTLLPKEILELYSIRVYEVSSLINFFEKRGFGFKDKLVLNNKAQILLEKQ